MIHLRKYLSTALTRRILTVPLVPAAGAQHTIFGPTTTLNTIRAIGIRLDGRVRDVSLGPSTAGTGTSQLHTRLPFLGIDSLLESELHSASTMGGRPIGEMPDVLFHQCSCFGVIEA